MITIKLNDLNISNYVLECPEEEVSILDGFSPQENAITIRNPNNSFTIDSPDSIFYGNSPSDFLLRKYYDDELITEYIILYIETLLNNKASITMKRNDPNIEQAFTAGYTNLTLSDIIRNIRNDYNLPIDLNSFISNISDRKFTLKYNYDNPSTLADFFSQLTDLLGLYVYVEKKQIKCAPVSLKYFNNAYYCELPLSSFLTYEIRSNFNDIINRVEIRHYQDNDVPLTVFDANSINRFGEKVKQLNGSDENIVIVMDAETAKIIADNYLTRFSRLIKEITAKLPINYLNYLYLGEIYLINGLYYQLMKYSFDIATNTVTTTFWSLDNE